jgi:uncharacterized protein
VRAFVPTSTISSRLGRNTAAAVALSSFFGAISSSCSYAAASMARTLLLKGSTWSNAVVFMVASTNLVFEIFIVIVTLLGWAFFGGEIAGGLIFIVISALVIASVYPSKVKQEAIDTASAEERADAHDKDTHHSMQHDHGAMHRKDGDHGRSKGTRRTKLAEAAGYFYMDVMMVGKDILIGVAMASVLMVVLPSAFWKALFLSDNSHLPHLAVLAWNALVGIVIAVLAFVCSVGNIVMATVLWQGGISFGGVIAFILADLVTVPMLMVYRKYYGLRTMWFLLITLTGCIFVTALLVDLSFGALHWIPQSPAEQMRNMSHAIVWNWQALLNVIFIPLSGFYFLWGKRILAPAGSPPVSRSA